MSLREGLRNGMTAFMAAAITFLVLELGLRLYHGEVFDFVSELRPTPNLAHTSRADYHPRPDVAPIQRPQPDARSVVEPQPTSLRLPLRDLQPLLPPDPLHPLVLRRYSPDS